MDAVGLIAFAKARGIDLAHVAGASSNTDGIAAHRKLTPAEIKFRKENHQGLDILETAKGRESRTYRRPAWTAADLGQAAGGLGVIPWAAALYSLAGSRDGYWLLKHALVNDAQRLARKEYWAPFVPTAKLADPPKSLNDAQREIWMRGVASVPRDTDRKFYHEDLAELVLIEDAHKHFFAAAPQLFALKMGVDVEVWDKHLDKPFRSLKATYDRWLSIACGTIGAWIRQSS